jgi:hypothetical protein
MAEVLPFPRLGELFLDARGSDRTMRVSLHPERRVAVISLWAGATCRATFRLPLDEATRLVEVLGAVPAPPAGTVDSTDELSGCGLPADDLPRAS